AADARDHRAALCRRGPDGDLLRRGRVRDLYRLARHRLRGDADLGAGALAALWVHRGRAARRPSDGRRAAWRGAPALPRRGAGGGACAGPRPDRPARRAAAAHAVNAPTDPRADWLAALAWQVELGADEAIGEAPVDRFAEAAPTVAESAAAPAARPSPQPRDE